VLIRKQDTSTVEIAREFAVVGPIFPFMENFAPANLLAYAPRRVPWPRVSSRLFFKAANFPEAAPQGVMIRYSTARVRSTNRPKESNVRLSRCA